MNKSRAGPVKYGSVSGTTTSGNINVTIISRHSKTIHKLVEEQMKKEAQELGFDPWGDTAQEEFERRVLEMEQPALENPEDDLEIMYYEQEGFN